MKITLRTLIASLGPLVAVAPPLAHHSFEAEYDRNKTVQVTGTVTRLDWMNHHARFYVDVKDESGKITNWNFELGSPNVLKRQGQRTSQEASFSSWLILNQRDYHSELSSAGVESRPAAQPAIHPETAHVF